jgi:hypothetical protein
MPARVWRTNLTAKLRCRWPEDSSAVKASITSSRGNERPPATRTLHTAAIPRSRNAEILQVGGRLDNLAAVICRISKTGHVAAFSISHMKRKFELFIELMKLAVAHRARSVAM